MRIDSLLKEKRPTFSFEIYPPKTQRGWERLLGRIKKLGIKKIDFISITSTSSDGVSVVQIAQDLLSLGITPLVHLTGTIKTRSEVILLLGELENLGVENVLVIRGEGELNPEGFQSTKELVAYLKGNTHFCIGVAGYPETHPESKSASVDWRNLTNKIEAGADFIITQLFFDNQDFFSFCQRLTDWGITQPVLAGLMPLMEERNLDQFKRFGVKVPGHLLEKFQSQTDPQQKQAVGLKQTVAQVKELIQNGAAGIHVYTMNNVGIVKTIFN